MQRYERDISQWAEADVVVVGGGLAGCAAAVAAAQEGAATVLIERTDVLGAAAFALPERLDGFAEAAERPLGGRFQRDLLAALGGGGVLTGGRLFTSPAALNRACRLWLEDAGADLLGATAAVDAWMRGDALCGVVCAHNGRLGLLAAHAAIDTTAMAAVATRAGAPHEDAVESECRQPLVVGLSALGVDPGHYADGGPGALRAALADMQRSDPLCGCRAEVLSPPPDCHAPTWVYLMLAPPADLRTPASRSAAAGRAQQAAAAAATLLTDRIPGFADAVFPDAAPSLATPDARRISSAAPLSARDLETGRQWPDAVGLVAPRNEGADAEANPWRAPAAIPYRCLVPDQVDGLLAAGDCFSAAIPSTPALRSGLASLVTGQAAGIAAALSARRNLPPRGLATEQITRRLAEQGAVLP
jgi:hypothetical protein